MPNNRNSLVEGFKKIGRAISPHRRSKSSGQVFPSGTPATSSVTATIAQGPPNTTASSSQTQHSSTSGHTTTPPQAGAQPTTSTQPNHLALPYIHISAPALSAGHSPANQNQNSVIPALKLAIEQYVAELSDDDRRAFLEAKDIIAELKNRDDNHRDNSVSRRLGTRVEKVLLTLRGFVNSVAICIQHHPDISSLVLGGFNCVLLMALGYVEFFEKLTTMMDKIAGHLTYLTKYGSPMFHHSTDIQNTLKDAYCDLLDFLLAVRKLFTEKADKGKYVNSVLVFLRIQWESFEYKFKPIEDKFEHHALVVVRSASAEDQVRRLEESHAKKQKEIDYKRREILIWLSPLDYSKAQRSHFSKHHAGTGEWLLQHHKFDYWKNSQDSAIIWCHGLPGAGKTVLASLVTNTLSAICQTSSENAICMLYCNYKEKIEPEIYVRTVIKQLCQRMKPIPYQVEALYDRHFNDTTEPSTAELQDIFMAVSSVFRYIYLVIDALDECTSESRDPLYSFLYAITSNPGHTKTFVKAFVTSRSDDDIRRKLGNFPIIEFEATKVNEDIKSYVEFQLDKRLNDGRLRLKDHSLKLMIVSVLVNRADGMFLWVEFQIKHICSQTSDYHIRATLEDLPEGIDETYGRIIDTIKFKPRAEKYLARRVLMWIAYATEPLTIFDLRSLAAMEKTINSYKDLQQMMPSEQTVLDVCANLVVVDSSIDPSDRKIRFVHYSVQEFLLSPPHNPYQPSIAVGLDIEKQTAHTEIAIMCIVFLLRCGNHEVKRAPNYPQPIMYIVHTWDFYVRELKQISPELMDLICNLFTSNYLLNKIPYSSWKPLDTAADWTVHGFYLASEEPVSLAHLASIYNLPTVLDFVLSKGADGDGVQRDATALHMACTQNSLQYIKALCSGGYDVNAVDNKDHTPLYYVEDIDACVVLLDHGAKINIEGGLLGSPLQAAVQEGRESVVEVLLQRGADANICGIDTRCRKPILTAASRGDIEIIKLLLAYGADINQPDWDGRHDARPLVYASLSGHKEAVELLLARGACVNWEAEIKGAALYAASESGHLEIAGLLLSHGADANARGGYEGYPIRVAARYAKDDMVKLLLEWGAEVNSAARDAYDDTLLQLLCIHGKAETISLALARGADVNAVGGNNGTALQGACERGRIDVVKTLIERGADVTKQAGLNGNALQAASLHGDPEIIKILISSGADVNARGGEYGTALQAASAEGNRPAVEVLLEYGADIHAQEGKFGYALIAASFSGHLEIVELLLSHGADLNAKHGAYGTALGAGVNGNHKEVVKLLLNLGADVNFGGEHTLTPLQYASFRGDLETTELLLSHGASVNASGGSCTSALIEVSRSLRGTDIMKLLLGHGAEVNTLTQGEYGYPLHAAAEAGQKECVSLLLAHGADVNATGGNCGTALIAACRNSREKIVKLLLGRGANATIEAGEYGHALQAASRTYNPEITDLLLAHGADINATGGKYGSALNAPITERHTTRRTKKAIRLLLAKGADVNLRSGKFGSALNTAIFLRDMKVVNILLEHGADVNLDSGKYGPALHMAAYMGEEGIMAVLLEHGADINGPGVYSGSALHAAARKGYRGAIRFLLDRGADVNRVGGKYGSPLDAASSNGYERIEELLREYGARTSPDDSGWPVGIPSEEMEEMTIQT